MVETDHALTAFVDVGDPLEGLLESGLDRRAKELNSLNELSVVAQVVKGEREPLLLHKALLKQSHDQWSRSFFLWINCLVFFMPDEGSDFHEETVVQAVGKLPL